MPRISETDRWSRLPAPWNVLGPQMAEHVRQEAARNKVVEPPAPHVFRGLKEFSGSALRKARLTAELSQDALAYLVGTSHYTVSKWERGLFRPQPRTAMRLAEKLGVDLAALCQVQEAA